MPIVLDANSWIGRNLFVLPYYGYGWGRPDLGGGSTSPLQSIGPEPFHFRAEDAIHCEASTMGIMGTIVEPKHQFQGHWCACLLRNPDECDFTTRPGHYMVWIAEQKLPVHPASQKALYEWVTFEKTKFCLCGYGVVAKSPEWIKDIYVRTMESRKLVENSQGKSGEHV